MKKLLKFNLPGCLILMMLLNGCDDGKLKYEEHTAKVQFTQSHYDVDTPDTYLPAIMRASVGNSMATYNVYFEVEDPEGWIGDICLIGNGVYKAANPAEDDYKIIYRAPMNVGKLQCALMIMTVAHPGEDIDRTLSFRIIPDPTEATQSYSGKKYYEPSGTTTATVTLKKLQ